MRLLLSLLLTMVLAGFAVTAQAQQTYRPQKQQKKTNKDLTLDEDSNAYNSRERDDGMTNSEFLHQAEDGNFELTPGLLTFFPTYNYRNNPASQETDKVVGADLNLTAEYGISSMFSAGLTWGYADTEVDATCNTPYTCNNRSSKGMDDPKVFAKIRFPAGPLTVRAGVTASIAAEHEIFQDSQGDTNVATGGITITPWAGLEARVGAGVLGGRLSYDAYQSDRNVDDQSQSPTLSYTISGGQTTQAAVFYEYNMGMLTYGAALVYGSIATESKHLNGTTTDYFDGATSYGVEFYLPVRFTPMITMLPLISYTVVNYASSTNALVSNYTYSSINTVSLGVAGRFTF